MSANEFGREGHFQICRSDAEQPWFVRWVSNYREIFRSSENYTRRAGALNAIKTLPGGAEWLASKTPLEVDERGQSAPPYRPSTLTITKGAEHLTTYNTGTTRTDVGTEFVRRVDANEFPDFDLEPE